MTCKDCIHRELCADYVSALTEVQNADVERISQWLDEIEGRKEQADNDCEHFKDRSRFVELRLAEWIEDVDMNGDFTFRCSDCDNEFIFIEGDPVENDFFYCPYCGAKMALCGIKNEAEQALKKREENPGG